jgi:pimeloyl-ACP methyl ester carboxylesterase
MLIAITQATSTRTCSRPSVDIWEATLRDRFLTDTHLHPYNLLFIERLCAIPVFCSNHTQTPSWTQRAYHKLIYYNTLDKGGHFAAWEQPQLFSEEIRAAFRPLR